MFNLGPLELVAIFVVALLVFGPDKLPEIGRQVGRGVREFRRIQSAFHTELRDVLEEPLSGRPAASPGDASNPELPTSNPEAPVATDVAAAPGDPDAGAPGDVASTQSPTLGTANGQSQSGSPAPGVNPSQGTAPEHDSP